LQLEINLLTINHLPEMKCSLFKVLFIVTFVVLSLSPLQAVPAYPSPVKYKQPDGSEITIQLKGDERVHWGETSDGYKLLSNGKNGWEYAIADKAGDLKVSGILAREINKRTSKELQLLKGVSKNIHFSPRQVNMLKSVWESKYGSDKLVGVGDFFRKGAVSSSNTDGRQKVFTPKGTKKLLMVLIQYPDRAFTFTKADFSNLMNTQDYNMNGALGSVRDFFLEMSYGQFDVTTDVVGIYTASQNMAYYGTDGADGSHDTNSNELMNEAITAADADVDFSQYDNDGDGTVDGVYIVYAGYGQASSGIANTIWPHAGGISGQIFDGKTISKYSCSNELNADNSLTGIGVICHEFGHVCGAPDYYDTDYATGGQFPGTGDWDLMCGGCYNGTVANKGNVPSHFNVFEKIRAGWVIPVTLTGSASLSIPDITTNPAAYIFNTTTANEYYILENRQKTGFNQYVDGHGLLIYRYSKSNWDAHANRTYPEGFYMVSANITTNPTAATSDPNAYGYVNTTSCPFPGSGNKTSFTDATIPGAQSWAGANTGYPLTNITENSGVISLCFNGCPTVNPILTFNAAGTSATQVNLTWYNNAAGNDVIIAANSSAAFGTLTNGTTYSTNDVLPGGGTIIFKGLASAFSHSGLTATTTYYYQIWALDGALNYSSTKTANATTATNSVAVTPFNEGFEGGAIPSGWSQDYVKESFSWAVSTAGINSHPAAAHTGSKLIRLTDLTWKTPTTRLVTQPLDLSGATSPVLKFWHTQEAWSGNQDKLRVYYRTSATADWTLLTIYNNSIADWTLETISLPNPTATYYIAFEGYAACGYGVCLDDIEVWKSLCAVNTWQGTVSANWFNPANWSCGGVPTTTNNIEIPTGTSYSPKISTAGAACQNITIDAGANLEMDGTNAYTLSVSGDWTNNGSFTPGISQVSFDNKTANQTISGSSATSFYTIKLNKGSQSNILEATSVITLNAVASNISLVAGTLKLSSASTITPLTSTYLNISSSCGIWNNGGNINSSSSYKQCNVNGLFKSTAGNSYFSFLLPGGSVNSIRIDGGTVNVSQYFEPYNVSTDVTNYNQTGGLLNIASANSSIPVIFNAGSVFNMSGGTISIQKASANTTMDYQNLAGTSSVTGGTLQIGNSTTSGSPVIRINSTVPVYNLTVNYYGSPTAQLLSNLTVLNNISILKSGTPAGKLIVPAGKRLTVNGAFSNDSGATGFVLQSDATGQATFVHNNTVAANVAGSVQQYLTSGRNWYVSSPVSDATSTALSSATSVAYYNEPTAAFITLATANPLTPLKGYISASTLTDGSVTFSGTLNDGAQTTTLTRTSGVTKTGFNLIGNPYPSYVNWDVAERVNMENTLWYRSKNANNTAYVFDTYNGESQIGTGNNGEVVNGNIPPMQAFWVRVMASGNGSSTTGSVTFRNSMRSHKGSQGAVPDVKLKSPTEQSVTQQVLRLQVSNGLNSDETIMLFNPNASNELDNYDSYKMTNGNSLIPEIFSTVAGESLAINGLNSIETGNALPLGFTTGESNTFTIKATQFSNFNNSVGVFIHDNMLNAEQELTKGDVYSFTSDATTTVSRFFVVFKNSSITTGLNRKATLPNVRINTNVSRQIMITCDDGFGKDDRAILYNSLGQKLVSQNLTTSTTILKANLISGVYLVSVRVNGEEKASKVIVK
jgi:M6 family metalloprotease-like protein